MAAATEHAQPPPPGMIPLTRNEIAHLAATLATERAHQAWHRLGRSLWRRRHQHAPHLPLPAAGSRRPMTATGGPPAVLMCHLAIDTARMELRAARVEDVSAIVAMDPGRLGSPGQIQALVRDQASLVAVEHGEIAGFLALTPGHFYGRDFIDLLFIAPRWRRRGAGRVLMQAALQNASTSRVFVSTNESNTPMRELLRSEGWTPSGVLTGLDEDDPEYVFFHDVPPG